MRKTPPSHLQHNAKYTFSNKRTREKNTFITPISSQYMMYTSPTDVLTDTEKKYKVNTYLMEKGFRINPAPSTRHVACGAMPLYAIPHCPLPPLSFRLRPPSKTHCLQWRTHCWRRFRHPLMVSPSPPPPLSSSL